MSTKSVTLSTGTYEIKVRATETEWEVKANKNNLSSGRWRGGLENSTVDDNLKAAFAYIAEEYDPITEIRDDYNDDDGLIMENNVRSAKELACKFFDSHNEIYKDMEKSLHCIWCGEQQLKFIAATKFRSGIYEVFAKCNHCNCKMQLKFSCC